MLQSPSSSDWLRRYRLSLAVFVTGLVLSGVTAFPLVLEMNLVLRVLGIDPNAPPPELNPLHQWLLTVRNGLVDTQSKYPWMAYGTDWLAFGHLAIAVFFIPAWKDPQRSLGLLHSGMIACIGVIPLALMCGSIREIPFGWRLIDCSFGILGIVPLLYCRHCLRHLEQESGSTAAG